MDRAVVRCCRSPGPEVGSKTVSPNLGWISGPAPAALQPNAYLDENVTETRLWTASAIHALGHQLSGGQIKEMRFKQ
jgi:hypothetical protein